MFNKYSAKIHLFQNKTDFFHKKQTPSHKSYCLICNFVTEILFYRQFIGKNVLRKFFITYLVLRLPSPDGVRVAVRCADSVFGSVLPLVSGNTLRPDFKTDEETEGRAKYHVKSNVFVS